MRAMNLVDAIKKALQALHLLIQSRKKIKNCQVTWYKNGKDSNPAPRFDSVVLVSRIPLITSQEVGETAVINYHGITVNFVYDTHSHALALDVALTLKLFCSTSPYTSIIYFIAGYYYILN
jgi:hypothetical protein